MDKHKLIGPLILIGSIIIFSSLFIRVFSGSETLAEYAARNPEAVSEEKYPETVNEEKFSETQLTEQVQTAEYNTAEDDAAVTPAKDVVSGGSTVHNETATGTGSETNDENNKENHKETAAENSINVTMQKGEDDYMEANPNRTVYKNGFYYEPLSEEIKKRITGISYPVTKEEQDSTAAAALNVADSAQDIQISYDDLCYMSVLHYNFHGVERTGELICNKAIAQDLVEIFYELYQNEYQIEQIRLIDEYSGDDTLSMQDNNTSCFNYRVVDGTSSLSKHAMGLAIDINPFFNPYVVFQPDGTTYISPKGSETYADRSQDFAYKIDENDLCYKLFKKHGFIWGGNWNSCKDYQHFQKVPE